MRERRFLTIGFVACVSAATVAFGCSEDDAIAPADCPTTPDAAPDTGASVDAGQRDTGSPAPLADAAPCPDATTPTETEDGAADAGPKFTSVVAATGIIEVADRSVTAQFYVDDSVIHAASAPECTIHLRTQTKPTSVAGTLKVGGTVVGSDGGTTTPISLDNKPYAYGGDVFPAGDPNLTVQIESTGNLVLPRLPVATLHTPLADEVAITKPLAEDGPDSIIYFSRTEPLSIEWTVPSGDLTNRQLIVDFKEVSGDTAAIMSLFCRYPLAAGSAHIPADVFAFMKEKLGVEPFGTFSIYTGEQKEITAGEASYVVQVHRPDTTSYQGSVYGQIE
jgi:hypothetical protein